MDKKTKVALMSYSMDNRQGKGSAIYTRRLIENLLNDDGSFDFTLVHYEKNKDPLYGKAKEIIIPKFLYPSRFLSQLYFFWLYRKSKFDIIHWFQPRAYPGYWWAPAKYKVITVHGGRKYLYPTFSLSSRMFEWVLKYTHHWFDIFIVGTDAAKDDIAERFGIKKELMRTTYYSGGEKYLPLDKEDSFRKINEKYPQIDRRFILNISRLQPNKNILNLVKAYIHLRDNSSIEEKLVIVAWPAQNYEEIYSAAKESRYASDIVFIDYLDGGLMNAMYSASEMFVFPSIIEGFGLPLVEAMSSGTPVITSKTSCMPEVVGDAGVLIDPYDYENLSDAMKRLLGDKELRGILAARGLERSKFFTWKNTAEATKVIYKELMNSHAK